MFFIDPRTYTHYKLVVCQDMIYTCQLKNIMELPRITHCVLNISSPSSTRKSPTKTKATAHTACEQIALQCISGQKGKTTRAHKSIAAFQLRKNDLLGYVISVRAFSLYSFVDQFITIKLPAALTLLQKTNNTKDLRTAKQNLALENKKESVVNPCTHVQNRPYLSEKSNSSTNIEYRSYLLDKQGLQATGETSSILYLSKNTKCTNYNFSGDRFTSFPGLEAHLLTFSIIRGFNCTFCALVANSIELTLLFTAFQIPFPQK